ncbi:MAG TPA: hypothetical protein VGU44_05870, partial [Gammaproteobacteria bacterium]|nr:hypothetical protein [Gammaproteobacteria bacterium]
IRREQMFTLPSKRMRFLETIPAIFICWKSLILTLLPLSFLGALFTSIPSLGLNFKLIQPFHSGFYIASVVSLILYLIPSGAIITRINNAVHGKSITDAQALNIGVLRLPKMLMTLIVSMFIFFLLPVLLMLFHTPGIWVYIIGVAFLCIVFPYFIPALPLVIIDNKWPFDALISSVRLVRHNWLVVFGALAIIYLINLAISFSLHALYAYNFLGNTSMLVATFIVSILTLPLWTAMTVIVTENLKRKK